jgi:uncharacterized protein YcaQ
MAISCQQLAGGNGVPAEKSEMLRLIRRLGCLQIDPMNVVARSQLLVLWSRLGKYELSDLETLLWQDKSLFEYWAHAASIVLTEDFPLHEPRMRTFARGPTSWNKKVLDWIEANESLRASILGQLADQGPLYSAEIECPPDVVPWQSSGWTDSRSVTVMLTFLWELGKIMVARRQGNGFGLKKQWILMEQHLPQWKEHEPWSEHDVVYRAAQNSLRALGVGTASHIKKHFIRGRYPGLDGVLEELVADGRIIPVQVGVDGVSDVLHRPWPGTWYVHGDDLPLLESLMKGEWQPRTTLLSPFDNLICDRDRAEMLFDFWYRIEIYTPKAKRKYGYYVMPILYGDQLIGRIDPKLDRKGKRLLVHAIHMEPGVEETAEVVSAVTDAIENLASFLGASDIVNGDETSGALPWRWHSA